CSHTEWLIPMSDVPRNNLGGSFHLHKKGEAIDEIKIIYENYAKTYNMMVVRDSLHFKSLLENDPYKDNEYLYTFSDEQGEAIAYVCLKRSGSVLKVLDYAFSNAKGMRGIIHIISKYSSSFEYFEIDLNSSFPLENFIPEITGIKRTTFTSGCVRVIDVKQILLLASYKGDGIVIISVIDNFIEKNNAVFEVVFKNGKAESVNTCSATPDITLEIADFSSLILGHTDINEFLVLYANDDKIKILEKVFFQKRCMIKEKF
ncbi:MAG: sterol carrier protein domain-containing protein, partial [Oscillospiraceae bacterium]